MDKDEEYDDWFSDNRIELMSDFIENLKWTQQQEWEKYLSEQFNRWKADRKNQ
jgi:hypothetical protein